MADKILALLKEGLSAWKTFIATRQEAYNRQKDKEQEKAIRYAEVGFERMGDVFQFLSDEKLIPENKKNAFNSLKKKVYYYKNKFNKYD